MSYQRLYPQRINWEDEPSLATPINQVNLNKMDSALYGIDERVVELDTNKVGKTETFNTSRNGVVPKPTQADITNEKVLRADGTWVEQSGGGGGGGGHTIVNNAGTSLTQRGKLKTVGGLNATDDGANNTTEITDVVEEVPWATWQSYPSEEAALQAHPNCVVTGAPDCDGDVEIENLHLAWSNQSPTSDFASQQITLNTDGNYNRIRVEFCYSTSFVNLRKSVDFQKGYGSFMDLTYAYPTNSNYSRTITYVSDTKIQIDTCYSGGVQSDNMLVPIAVYTYKDDLTAKIQAIARNVKATQDYSETEHVVGTWTDGSTLYEKTFNNISLPNNTTKNVAHGISNIGEIISIEGVMKQSTAWWTPLPFIGIGNLANSVRVDVTDTNLVFTTGGNHSSDIAKVTIRYTKTS